MSRCWAKQKMDWREKLLFVSILTCMVIPSLVQGLEDINATDIKIKDAYFYYIIPFGVKNPITEFRTYNDFDSIGVFGIDSTYQKLIDENLRKWEDEGEIVRREHGWEIYDYTDTSYRVFLHPDRIVILRFPDKDRWINYTEYNVQINEFKTFVEEEFEAGLFCFENFDYPDFGDERSFCPFLRDERKRYQEGRGALVVIVEGGISPSVSEDTVKAFKKFHPFREAVIVKELEMYALYQSVHSRPIDEVVVINPTEDVGSVFTFESIIELRDFIYPYAEKQREEANKEIEEYLRNLRDIESRLSTDNVDKINASLNELNELRENLTQSKASKIIQELNILDSKEKDVLQDYQKIQVQIFGEEIRQHNELFTSNIEKLENRFEYLSRERDRLAGLAESRRQFLQQFEEMKVQTKNTRRALYATIIILIITIWVGVKQIFQSKEQIKSSSQDSKQQIEKLEQINSKLGKISDDLKTSKAKKKE